MRKFIFWNALPITLQFLINICIFNGHIMKYSFTCSMYGYTKPLDDALLSQKAM